MLVRDVAYLSGLLLVSQTPLLDTARWGKSEERRALSYSSVQKKLVGKIAKNT